MCFIVTNLNHAAVIYNIMIQECNRLYLFTVSLLHCTSCCICGQTGCVFAYSGKQSDGCSKGLMHTLISECMVSLYFVIDQSYCESR